MADADENDGLLVRHIRLDGLFGLFDYDLPLNPAAPEGQPLAILYGDNGCGKTTVLRLLFNMLSPEPYAGHRSAIGEVPFRSLAIEATGGLTLSAIRQDATDGPYLVRVEQPGAPTLDYLWSAPRSRRASSEETSENDLLYEKFCGFLAEHFASISYLTDDRKMYRSGETTASGESLAARRRRRPELIHSSQHAFFLGSSEEETPKYFDERLADAVRRASEWFRQQALGAANTGAASANSIYLDVIRQIAQFGSSKSGAPDSETDLEADVRRLHERIGPYSALGLSPSFDAEQLIGELRRVSSAAERSLARQVLEPYLNGIRARLDALEEVQTLMNKLIDNVERFYAHKRLRITVRDGLEILLHGDQQLPLGSLSSGEKQLLLMLCETIIARDQASLFMIDEPEISLNVKWQRTLLDTLLGFVKDAKTQFIMATHSIELLSKYRDYVVQLAPLER